MFDIAGRTTYLHLTNSLYLSSNYCVSRMFFVSQKAIACKVCFNGVVRNANAPGAAPHQEMRKIIEFILVLVFIKGVY